MKKSLLFALTLLFATATMAQNRSVLLQESFDGASMPAGWSIVGLGQSNWNISATNNAGGEPYEMCLYYNPQFNGISRLVSPVIDLTGLNSVIISFKHSLDNYSGSHTLGIATTSDGGTTWNEGWSQTYNSDDVYSVIQEITTPDVGSANFQFCIYYSGNSYNIDNWYFDDIIVFNLEYLDLGLTSVTLGNLLNSGEASFGINVFNYGATTVTSVSATYTVEGLVPVTQTFAVNIPSLGSQTLYFATTTMLEPGTYNVTYSINLVNGQQDNVSSNNTLEKPVSVAIGTAEKIPMIEHFSASTCAPCAGVNTAMQTFCNNNSGRFTYTKYQMNWPGNGDPYYSQEGGTRRTYYGVNAVPQCFLDGEDQGFSAIQQTVFDEHANRVSFIDLRGSFTMSGNTITVKADIMPFIDINACVYISINEKETTGNVGTNGETSFHHIFMKMLPNAQGTSINFTSCVLQHLEFTQDLSGTFVEEMSDLEVAIWVQDNTSKEIYNSRFAYEYTNVHPYPVQNLTLVPGGNGTLKATWNAPSNGNPMGYKVYVNGQVAVESTTALTYNFTGGTSYNTVAVQALYRNGSNSVTVYKGLASNPTWCVVATANPMEGGLVTGSGYYESGQTCTLTATANNGYTFVNWTENGTQVSTDPTYTFTVTGNRNLVANFEEVGAGYHWDVNIHTYPNTLIMVGVVMINGEEQATDMLEVGAFCNGECRGRERLSGQYYQIFGRYFVNLTVYGEDGDEISFRLYDHATETELDLTCDPISFATNAVFGNPVNPHVLDFGPNSVTQTTNFAEGWNWWSTYIDQSGIDGLTMLEEGLGDKGVTIKSQGDGFVQYMNYGGYSFWYGTLDHIANSQTYMVQTEAAVRTEMTGTPVSTADSPITISEGWNWIGFPSAVPMDFNTAFSGITPSNNDIVKTQNSFAQYMVYGSYSFWYGELSTGTVFPGTGLMYKSENSGSYTFTYPTTGRATALAATTAGKHWTNNVHAYPANMTVLAVVELNDIELRSDSYELAAFADGECRGSAKLMYVEPLNRYMAFLTVSGNEAAELHFGLYNAETGEENYTSSDKLVYATDAALGSYDEPMVISFRGTTGLDAIERDLQVYPNPVEKGERFSINLPVGSEVRVDVVNALGAIISTETSTKAAASLLAPNAPGVYTLRITVEGEGTSCRKLVVK